MKPLISIIILLFLTSSWAKLLPISPANPLSGREWPKGSVWPLPLSQSISDVRFSINPETFRISTNVSGNCLPLDFALGKYNNEFLFKSMDGIVPVVDPAIPAIPNLSVKVFDTSGCQNYPTFSNRTDVYEHYTLTINGLNPEIVGDTVWGALRGLETFSQLIWSNDEYDVQNGPFHFYINVTTINDYPRFAHRGLMVDTARHYQPEIILLDILDGMLYNKLNVFHWHLTDDQSFPFVSTTFPELSAKGAFSSRHVYTPEAVQRVIEAARVRGIRVILEFDTPGHTHSFGFSFPELLTPCYGIEGEPGTPNPPEHAAYENLDPTKEFTYDFMRQLFTEIKNVSKDEYIHLGMDEVYPPCWESSPEIKAFMIANNYSNISQVQGHYIQRHVDMVQRLGAIPISWQDPLDFDVEMDKGVVVQVWKDWGIPWEDHFRNVIDQGYKVLLSSPWYVNYISYGESWRNYYEADPILSLPNLTPEQKSQILGGEACIWAEFVDKSNIISRLFPSVSAVAERLWSHDIPISSSATNDARKRLDEHRCRMMHRGLSAQPLLCGYCGPWEV